MNSAFASAAKQSRCSSRYNKFATPFGLAMTISCLLLANPYPDESKAPRLPIPSSRGQLQRAKFQEGLEVLRVQVDWAAANESFGIASVVREKSGTESLMRRALRPNPFGSYRARLEDAATHQAIYHDAIGTGQEFRRLTRAFTFRFPMPAEGVEFVLTAENPTTGVMEEVLRQPLSIPAEKEEPLQVEVKSVLAAETTPSILVSIYSEGYSYDAKEKFWRDADKAAKSLRQYEFPGAKRMEFQAVFSPSNLAIGSAQDLGLPVAERDTFLGLYFPYWNKFGRWYHVVYPTRESRYRRAVGQVAYDYPLVLVDNASYWGIGNFNELTAVPSSHPSFIYLLTHEFGHFFGLNEEYEGGGPTELSFSPGITEPWSQNITFDPKNVKWKQFVAEKTPLPTPQSYWQGGQWGAYLGGYADSEPQHHSHKPGYSCTMESGTKFCPVCRAAIEAKITFDLNQAK